MVRIEEVKSKKQMKLFVEFPLELYKDNPYYVPAFYRDEINLFFPSKNVFAKTSKAKFFLAYKDGKLSGRIAGIMVYAYAQKIGRKVMRFSRIDMIDDAQVADALFAAVEDFAREEGAQAIHGPMGFADTDREGLLIEGFDRISTFAENYSYDYYPGHVERNGYEKEADWVEYLLEIPQEPMEKIKKLSQLVAKRYGLNERAVKGLSMRKLIDKYSTQLFDVLNQAYAPLHGTIPLEGAAKDEVISQFKIFLRPEYISVITDKDDHVVGFGVVLPSLAKELIRCRGKLSLGTIIRILKIKRKPEFIEFALIAVRPDYHRKGVNAMIMQKIHEGLIAKGVKQAETNLELESNTAVISQWDGFDKTFIKRRRCYIKEL